MSIVWDGRGDDVVVPPEVLFGGLGSILRGGCTRFPSITSDGVEGARRGRQRRSVKVFSSHSERIVARGRPRSCCETQVWIKPESFVSVLTRRCRTTGDFRWNG